MKRAKRRRTGYEDTTTPARPGEEIRETKSEREGQRVVHVKRLNVLVAPSAQDGITWHLFHALFSVFFLSFFFSGSDCVVILSFCSTVSE